METIALQGISVLAVWETVCEQIEPQHSQEGHPRQGVRPRILPSVFQTGEEQELFTRSHVSEAPTHLVVVFSLRWAEFPKVRIFITLELNQSETFFLYLHVETYKSLCIFILLYQNTDLIQRFLLFKHWKVQFILFSLISSQSSAKLYYSIIATRHIFRTSSYSSKWNNNFHKHNILCYVETLINILILFLVALDDV